MRDAATCAIYKTDFVNQLRVWLGAMTGRCKKSDKCENEVAEVVDLFCGAGALSHGLRLAGLKILAGYDVDARCQHAFEKNNDASFFT